jgi:hypothetical protein
MHIFLFIVYGLALCYAITKIPFLRKTRIKPPILVSLFILHVGVGCLHDLVAYRFYPQHGDIWLFFQESLITRQELAKGFGVFWADNSSWASLPHNMIQWGLLLLNYLSFDNLYIDTLLFSFLVFMGNSALFRAFSSRFPGRPLSCLGVFLLPSTLFWTSCVHTEGVLYALLGFLLYYLQRSFSKGWTATRIGCCLFLFAFAALFRPPLALALLPALLLWGITLGPENKRGLIRGVSRKRFLFVCCWILLPLILLVLLKPHYLSRPLQVLSQRQEEFRVLSGNSRIFLPVLEPTWSSLARLLPVAAFNGYFQPLPGSGGKSIYLIFSLELALIWGIIVYSLFFGKLRPPDFLTPFGIGCILFALLGMSEVGMVVPFAGAIIRYRSIYLPFLLFPFLVSLPKWKSPSGREGGWVSAFVFEGPSPE